ncbi:DUF4214 domain-containing protein [Pararhizobium haloflavum]|uniref:DUF4214 domain-containing protein n=1 Tax=Pararhizobium haloflavum TaxID=2037914 RepID=UPI000C19CD20|nr:DUF4214 domain-containing protein [Pararhizobium haloflavum]
MSSVKSVQTTGNSVVDDLLASYAWSDKRITFGFTKSPGDYGRGYGGGEADNGYAPLSAIQMAAARDAFAAWDDLIAIDIVEAAGATADLRLANSSVPATAWAYLPGTSDVAGDIWFGRAKGYYDTPDAGNYAYMTMLHEIGHALGLTHPHDAATGSNFSADDGSAGIVCPCCAGAVHRAPGEGGSQAIFGLFDGSDDGASTGPGTTGSRLDAAYFGTDAMPGAADAMAATLMSYASFVGDSGGYKNEYFGYAQTPMLRDIAAVQYIYGADYSTRAGDTVYRFDPFTGEMFIDGRGAGAPADNRVFETLWDGGGRDTIDLAAYGTGLVLDLGPGSWSDFGTQTAGLGRGHEAPGNLALAYLSRGDARGLVENAIGGSGHDVITGNRGDNVLVGGAGDDRLEAVAGTNILAGDGVGNAFALLGLQKADWITASLPASVMPGNDRLVGGEGNDIFVLAGGRDVVEGGGGVDTLVIDLVHSAISMAKEGLGLLLSYAGGEVLAFDATYLAARDGIFALSELGNESPRQSVFDEDIALLYSAGLGREIEQSGLDYWSATLQSGKPLAYMAAHIIDSDEFCDRFGEPETMGDPEFIDRLYMNVLDRGADGAGADYWCDAMSDGLSRPDVLLRFAVSDENRSQLAQDAPGTTTGQPADLYHDLWA